MDNKKEKVIKSGTTPNGQNCELIEITTWTPGVAGTKTKRYECRGAVGVQRIPVEKLEKVLAMIKTA